VRKRERESEKEGGGLGVIERMMSRNLCMYIDPEERFSEPQSPKSSKSQELQEPRAPESACLPT